MKALIIILAVVTVSFLGLLVYGESRGEQAGDPAKNCHSWPVAGGETPSEDQLKDWCPPSLADATKGLQARFGRGLGLKDPAMLRSGALDATFIVKSSDQDTRAAKIKLIGGDAAILSDGDRGQLCLCKPGTQIDSALFGDQCPANWKRKHREDAKPTQQDMCQKNDDIGAMPFGRDAGRIVLKPQPPAAVSIR